VVEQDKVRALTCMCIEKGEKQFKVADQKGEQLFVAVEDKDLCCQRCGCCCTRDYDVFLKKKSEDEEHFYNYHVKRTCCTRLACLSCCRLGMNVEDTKAKSNLGTVASDCQCCSCWPKFTVNNESGAPRFIVQQDSHFCANCLCCGARSRQCCGIDCYIPASLSITPHPSGKSTEIVHQAGGRGADDDAYQVTFPEGASVNDKLLLVAATLCIDYKMYTSPAQEKMESGKGP